MLTFRVVDRMKSQASLEFMQIVMIVLVFLLVTYTSIASTQFSAQEEEVQRKLSSICGDITDKINKAVYFGFGFSQNISLWKQIYGNNYTLKINDNKTLICSTSKFSIIETFIENKITNSTSNPPFFIPIRTIKISNSRGTVVIA